MNDKLRDYSKVDWYLGAADGTLKKAFVNSEEEHGPGITIVFGLPNENQVNSSGTIHSKIETTVHWEGMKSNFGKAVSEKQKFPPEYGTNWHPPMAIPNHPGSTTPPWILKRK